MKIFVLICVMAAVSFAEDTSVLKEKFGNFIRHVNGKLASARQAKKAWKELRRDVEPECFDDEVMFTCIDMFANDDGCSLVGDDIPDDLAECLDCPTVRTVFRETCPEAAQSITGEIEPECFDDDVSDMCMSIFEDVGGCARLENRKVPKAFKECLDCTNITDEIQMMCYLDKEEQKMYPDAEPECFEPEVELICMDTFMNAGGCSVFEDEIPEDVAECFGCSNIEDNLRQLCQDLDEMLTESEDETDDMGEVEFDDETDVVDETELGDEMDETEFGDEMDETESGDEMGRRRFFNPFTSIIDLTRNIRRAREQDRRDLGSIFSTCVSCAGQPECDSGCKNCFTTQGTCDACPVAICLDLNLDDITGGPLVARAGRRRFNPFTSVIDLTRNILRAREQERRQRELERRGQDLTSIGSIIGSIGSTASSSGGRRRFNPFRNFVNIGSNLRPARDQERLSQSFKSIGSSLTSASRGQNFKSIGSTLASSAGGRRRFFNPFTSIIDLTRNVLRAREQERRQRELERRGQDVSNIASSIGSIIGSTASSSGGRRRFNPFKTFVNIGSNLRPAREQDRLAHSFKNIGSSLTSASRGQDFKSIGSTLASSAGRRRFFNPFTSVIDLTRNVLRAREQERRQREVERLGQDIFSIVSSIGSTSRTASSSGGRRRIFQNLAVNIGSNIGAVAKDAARRSKGQDRLDQTSIAFNIAKRILEQARQSAGRR